MSSNKSVTATFASSSATYTLTVTKGGTGTGTVTGSSGISCGSTCSYAYTYGTIVTLTQAAATGSGFAGWSGACKGTGTCQVRMTSDKSVGATFNTCAYTIYPTARTVGRRSASVTVNITSQKGCAKPTASVDSGYTDWLEAGSVVYDTSRGKGSVRISVDSNTTGAQRSGTVTIAGQTFTVTQSTGR